MTNDQTIELYKITKSYLNKNNISWDEDLLEDIMIYLIKIYDLYDPSKGSLTTYIYACIKYRILAIANEKHRKKNCPDQNILSLDSSDNKNKSDLYCLFPQYDIYNLYDEDRAKFIEEIKPLLCQETIEYYFQHKSKSELAEKYGVSISAIGLRIRTNIERIQRYCKKKKIKIGEI